MNIWLCSKAWQLVRTDGGVIPEHTNPVSPPLASPPRLGRSNREVLDLAASFYRSD
jgi:hypothetical protein